MLPVQVTIAMPPLLDSATQSARSGARSARRIARAVNDALAASKPVTAPAASPSDAATLGPATAAAAVWISARTEGARSPAVYEQALRSAFAIDAARDALSRTRDHRTRAAGGAVGATSATRPTAPLPSSSSPSSPSSSPPPSPSPSSPSSPSSLIVIEPAADPAVDDQPDLQATLACYSSARSAIRSICMAAACAGVRRDATIAPLLGRVCVASCMVDPAHNPLLGHLAGTPERAARALVDGEPLIRDGRLVHGHADVDLDDLDHLTDLLHAATLATLGRAPTRLGRVRDLIAPAR